jgi:hypothetical protein
VCAMVMGFLSGWRQHSERREEVSPRARWAFARRAMGTLMVRSKDPLKTPSEL